MRVEASPCADRRSGRDARSRRLWGEHRSRAATTSTFWRQRGGAVVPCGIVAIGSGKPAAFVNVGGWQRRRYHATLPLMVPASGRGACRNDPDAKPNP
jgi:hypothetical protein